MGERRPSVIRRPWGPVTHAAIAALVATAHAGDLPAQPQPTQTAIDAAEAEVEALRRQLSEAEARLRAAKAAAAPPAPPAPATQPPAAQAPAAPPPAAAKAAQAAKKSPDPASPADEPKKPPGLLDGWKFKLEIGFNGATGNSDRNSFRGNIAATRKTDSLDTAADASFRYTEREGDAAENRFQLNLRNDWLFSKESGLRYFVKGSYEADEFQAWDTRLSGFTGLGYDLLKDTKITLTTRAGLGGSQRFGGPDEAFRSEAFLGADLSYKLAEGYNLSAGIEYLPDSAGFDEYRLNSKIGLEMKLDPKRNLFVKIGASNRYDSEPGNRNRNADTDYFVTLGVSF